MSRSRVAVVRTAPRSVLEDTQRVMRLGGVEETLAKDVDTALKVNISWHFFYPASSTTPWQLDGVIRGLLAMGYDRDLIHACHNRTVVIDAHLGERENKHLEVVERHGLRNVHLYEGEEWVHVREAVGDLANDFLVLNDVYPDGFSIPKRFIGENILHLPTVKTHVFTTTTGAMKNAFGGLLNERRHWTHPVIHETLVDLLMIQKKIHRGVFAVMDGTFAGDGPGPRCMTPYVKNIILASEDQVAIDAVAAKLMGMDPLSIKFIKLAHDLGLGDAAPKRAGSHEQHDEASHREPSQRSWRTGSARRQRGETPPPDVVSTGRSCRSSVISARRSWRPSASSSRAAQPAGERCTRNRPTSAISAKRGDQEFPAPSRRAADQPPAKRAACRP